MTTGVQMGDVGDMYARDMWVTVGDGLGDKVYDNWSTNGDARGRDGDKRRQLVGDNR